MLEVSSFLIQNEGFYGLHSRTKSSADRIKVAFELYIYFEPYNSKPVYLVTLILVFNK